MSYLRTFFTSNLRIKLFALFAIGTIFLLWFVFPQPDYSLWPAKEKNNKFILYVTVNGYHSCINFPDFESGLYQEWHMGAKEWYLGKNAKLMEVATKAAKGKISAVIKFGLYSQPYWERNRLPKKQVFTFWLSQKGFHRLINELHKFRGKAMTRKGNFWYFPYKRGYHLIENCNVFTARALKAGGLPIREILAQEGQSMTWQLNRCLSIQNLAFSNAAKFIKK